MRSADLNEVISQGGLERLGKQGHPVPSSLPVPDPDLPTFEIDVLDPQPRAFQEAEPRAVQERPHEPWRTGQVIEDPGHLGAGEDDRKPGRPPGSHQAVEPFELDPQHLAVEKQDRAQGLVLGRRADVPLDGEMREKGGGLRLGQLPGMAHPVEPDVAADPSDVRLLGTGTVPVKPDGGAHPREESR